MERTLNGRFILESQREEARQLAKELIAAGFISTECELLLRVSKSTPNFWPPDTSPQRTKRRLVARAMREQGIVPVPRKGPVYLETFNLDTQPAPTQLVEQTDEGGNFVIIMGRGNALSKAMASLKDFLKN